jgi:hypothetical protein
MKGVQQRIARVTSTDGTSLAYSSIGAGRPLLYVSGWLSHLELSWELSEERAFYEHLAEGCRLVRYDRAGCGLSPYPAIDAPTSPTPSTAKRYKPKNRTCGSGKKKQQPKDDTRSNACSSLLAPTRVASVKNYPGHGPIGRCCRNKRQDELNQAPEI